MDSDVSMISCNRAVISMILQTFCTRGRRACRALFGRVLLEPHIPNCLLGTRAALKRDRCAKYCKDARYVCEMCLASKSKRSTRLLHVKISDDNVISDDGSLVRKGMYSGLPKRNSSGLKASQKNREVKEKGGMGWDGITYG